MVGEDLGKGKGGFNGEAGVAEEGDVEGGTGDWGQEDVDCEEGYGEVGEELVVSGGAFVLVTDCGGLIGKSRRKIVRARGAPLPKIVRARS